MRLPLQEQRIFLLMFIIYKHRGIVSYQNKVKENASLRRYYPGQVIRVDEIISQHVVNTIWYKQHP